MKIQYINFGYTLKQRLDQVAIVHGFNWRRYQMVRSLSFLLSTIYLYDIQVIVYYTVPGSPPMDIVATAVSAEMISIQWKAPPLNDRNGRIIAYHIMIKNHDTEATRSANVSGNSYSFVAEGNILLILRSIKIMLHAVPFFLCIFKV